MTNSTIDELRYQLKLYADRNKACHTNIGGDLEIADFTSLTKKIVGLRKNAANRCPACREADLIRAQQTIQRFQDQYYEWINDRMPHLFTLIAGSEEVSDKVHKKNAA